MAWNTLVGTHSSREDMDQRLALELKAATADVRPGKASRTRPDRMDICRRVCGIVRWAESQSVAGLRTYNTAVAALGKLQLPKQARRVFDHMRVHPNHVTYSNLAVAYDRAGDAAGATEVVDEMLRRGFVPTAQVYTLKVRRLAAAGDPTQAAATLDLLVDLGRQYASVSLRTCHVFDAAAACATHTELDALLDKYLPHTLEARGLMPAAPLHDDCALRRLGAHLRLAATAEEAAPYYEEARGRVRARVSSEGEAAGQRRDEASVYTRMLALRCREDPACFEGVWGDAVADGALLDDVLCGATLGAGQAAVSAADADGALRLRGVCEQVFGRARAEGFAARNVLLWQKMMGVYAAATVATRGDPSCRLRAERLQIAAEAAHPHIARCPTFEDLYRRAALRAAPASFARVKVERRSPAEVRAAARTRDQRYVSPGLVAAVEVIQPPTAEVAATLQETVDGGVPKGRRGGGGSGRSDGGGGGVASPFL